VAVIIAKPLVLLAYGDKGLAVIATGNVVVTTSLLHIVNPASVADFGILHVMNFDTQ
jgi:hypothetical protein